ncbi:hypothetical protein Q674_08535 [Acinetobacter sp. COS3]|nr:hypothetical protein Q674_08535 [Acinetobacter sp. COS3]
MAWDIKQIQKSQMIIAAYLGNLTIPLDRTTKPFGYNDFLFLAGVMNKESLISFIHLVS